jgi:butyrate kinase
MQESSDKTGVFDIETALEDQIFDVMKNRPTVALTEPLDPRIVEAACHLARYARLVFLAPEAEVRAVVDRDLPHLDPTRVEFTMQASTFVDPSTADDLLDEFAEACMNLPEELRRASTLGAVRGDLMRPSHFGIMAVRCGHADMVVGGMDHKPREYFRPMLRLLQVNKIMCETGVFVLPPEHPTDIFPHNIVVFGDVGVNATMTPETLARCAVGTCAIARDIIPESVLPVINGAIVSYSHKGSDEGESPELVRQATKLVPEILAERIKSGERYRTINIEGEVKISTALSRRSAMYYRGGAAETLSGRTNVIIAPNLDLGNLLFHLYSTRYPDAKKFAAMYGIRFKGVDLSMDSTAKDAELAIKANILRMHKFGHWDRTPKDTFFPRRRILAVNPGSTSTKISVYEGDLEQFTAELQHSAAQMEPFENQPITAQHTFRKNVILETLAEHDLTLDDLDAIAARGGLVRPIPHGTYAINEDMLRDLRDGIGGEHASNLGALIADELTVGHDLPTFIVDPVVVDEVWEQAKITGFKEIKRLVISHALNQIATAQRFANENETFYDGINVIVAHMGGGITVGAHRHGRYIDVNNGLNGEGPFSPQRSGSIPTGQLIQLCYSGKYTEKEIKKLNKGRGGLIDLLGTSDLREIEKRINDGDEEARVVFDAMTYQIAKEIAGLLPAFQGEALSGVLLTGGMARSETLVAGIKSYLPAACSPVTVYPGENEMSALVKGVLRVLNGKEDARSYDPEAM